MNFVYTYLILISIAMLNLTFALFNSCAYKKKITKNNIQIKVHKSIKTSYLILFS